MENRDFDVVLIGTGMGALTTASLLAQFTEKKVLLLEKHFKAGGFTHTFRREGKYLWDVGIHYIGDMQEGSFSKKIFDIVTGGTISWNAMPEVFEKFVFSDFTFSVRNKENAYQQDLIDMFPEEKEAIQNYFSDVKKVSTWQGRHMLLKGLAPFVETYAKSLNLQGTKSNSLTTKEYMDQNFRSEKLKSILCSQWGDYGLPPSLSSFAIHALVVSHYLNGGFYPDGGSGGIAESVRTILESKGGKILTSRSVEEILLENGKAVGVKVKNIVQSRKAGHDVIERYYCDSVISNAGAYNTYTRLLPPETPIPFKEELIAFSKKYPKISNVTLYIGLKEDPRKFGFYGENHWIYSDPDHDKNFRTGMNWPTTGNLPGAYLSFPSLKDSEPMAHTAEIIAFCEYSDFAKWKDQPWRERDEEYQEKKKSITEQLLSYLEKHYPGFKENVAYSELATPITTEYFTSHLNGTIYGMPCVTDRFNEEKSPWTQPRTPVPNLFLTGADTSSPGVIGAMMGGVLAFVQASGISFMEIIKSSVGKAKLEAQKSN